MRDKLLNTIIIAAVALPLAFGIYIESVVIEKTKQNSVASEKRIIKAIRDEFEDAGLICPDNTMMPYEMHGLEKQKCNRRRFKPWEGCE